MRLLGGPEWAGEVDLHRVVIMKLLAALVRRRAVCEQLMQLNPWQQLAGTELLSAAFLKPVLQTV